MSDIALSSLACLTILHAAPSLAEKSVGKFWALEGTKAVCNNSAAHTKSFLLIYNMVFY